MKEKDFDNKLRSGLEDYRSEVNIDQLWGAIEPQVDEINDANKKDRKPIFWWLFSTGLLIGAVAVSAFLLLGHHENDNLLDKSSISASSIEKTQYSKTQSNTNNIPVEKTNDTKTADATIDIDKKNTVTSSSKSETIKKATQQTVIAESINTKQKSSVSKSNKTKFNKPNSNKLTVSNSTKFTKSSNGDFVNGAPFTSKQKNADTSTFQKENNTIATLTNIPSNTNNNIQYNNKPTITFQNINLLTTLLFPIQQLDKLQSPLPIHLLEVEKAADQLKLPKPWIFYTGLEGGIYFANKKLSANAPEFSDYLQMRKDTEKALETMSVSKTITAKHHSGWYAQTGIQYAQINEKLTYTDTSSVHHMVQGLFAWRPNPYHDLLPVYDVITHTTDTVTLSQIYNRYKLLEIPLNIGHEFSKGKWSLGLQSGITMNLQFKATGNILNEQANLINLQENQQTIFRKNIGLAYQFSAVVGYQLNNQFRIHLRPELKNYINSFSQTNASIEQHYRLYGLQVGINYEIR